MPQNPLNLAAALALSLPFSSLHASLNGPFEGILLPFKEVVISSPVQSTVESIAFKEGDRVKAGQTLTKLYARVEELDTQRAKAALEKREFDFKSSSNLFKDKIISEDEALKNKIELELARLQYEQAKELLQQRTILAPIDGLVVEKLKETGETVTATQPLFRLMDIRQVYVQFYIRTEELPALHTGQTVAVGCVLGNQTHTLPGKVDFIDPRADAASGLLRVKVLVDNPDELVKPGLRATVTIPGSK